MENMAKKIYQRLMRSNRILLVPHKEPDGDALGSVASFMQYLRTKDISHTAYCQTTISPKMHFLPHIQYITNDDEIWKDESYDTVIVFDSGDLRYAGIADKITKRKNKPFIINIDHHITNENFGDLNMVNTKASSTTEILYRFFNFNEIKIDKDIATCLLTGLVTDTDNFTNAATTTSSLNISSNLVNKGGNLNLIKGWVFKDKTVNSLKLWGVVLSRLKKHEELDIVYTYLTQKDLKEFHVGEEEANGMANFLNNIKDGKAGLIIKETEDGKVKGSFRTTYDEVDVGAMAVALGGGGHKKAAGFTVEGNIEQAFNIIFSRLQTLEQN